MTRALFSCGWVIDGAGAPPAATDPVIKDGRIAAIGSGLDGDEVVGCTGRGVLPGLFDSHVHLIAGSPNSWCNSIDDLHEPFSMQFFRAALNIARHARDRDHDCARRLWRRPQDQGGAGTHVFQDGALVYAAREPAVQRRTVMT